jgi:D-3-phosphoglycerate dehydrogenase
MRIVFADPAHPFLADWLRKQGHVCDLHYDSDRPVLKHALCQAQGLVVRSRTPVDEDLLDHAPQLRFVARVGVGTEHIDMEACAERGIAVLTSPEGSRDAVAEHTFGLLLMLLHKLALADWQIRAGQWLREPNRGTELNGKTVGILGYGNMGAAFARRLVGFNVRVIAYDKFRSDYGDAYAEAVDLPTLQAESQVLSIYIPYMPSNHHFVDGAFLDAFVHPVYLINTARGKVLHTPDLVARLENGRVAGAALDVIEYEEMSFVHLGLDGLPEPFQRLRQMDQVVLNPHIAGWSHEAKERHARVLAQKMRVWLNKTST